MNFNRRHYLSRNLHLELLTFSKNFPVMKTAVIQNTDFFINFIKIQIEDEIYCLNFHKGRKICQKSVTAKHFSNKKAVGTLTFFFFT